MKSWRFLLIAVSVAFAWSCTLPADADDGILYYHGGPQLMKGGANIRMVQEFVRAKVGMKTAKVYCRFVFRNEGPATTARIGFPDGNEQDREHIDDPIVLKPGLRGFRSCVDNRPVTVRVERADLRKSEFAFFHVKNVRFGRNQTRVIEDWYETPLNVSNAWSNADSPNAPYPLWESRSFSYTMSSGASWKGNIGKATVQVDFESANLRSPNLAPFNIVEHKSIPWNDLPKSRIYWQGFSKPTVRRGGVVFYRRNFEPVVADDIFIVFGSKHR